MSVCETWKMCAMSAPLLGDRAMASSIWRGLVVVVGGVARCGARRTPYVCEAAVHIHRLTDLVEPVRLQRHAHRLVEGPVVEAALEHALDNRLQPRVHRRGPRRARARLLLLLPHPDVLVQGLGHQRVDVLGLLLRHVEEGARAQAEAEGVVVLLEVEEDLGGHHGGQLAGLLCCVVLCW